MARGMRQTSWHASSADPHPPTHPHHPPSCPPCKGEGTFTGWKTVYTTTRRRFFPWGSCPRLPFQRKASRETKSLVVWFCGPVFGVRHLTPVRTGRWFRGRSHTHTTAPPANSYSLWEGRALNSELRSCVKVEVAVLGSRP